MGEFLLQSSAVWLNPLPCLRRLRKEPELTLFGTFVSCDRSWQDASVTERNRNVHSW